MISTLRSEASDARRAEIAAAARSLIAERGFEGLRTRDIAERVGINIATLHYHVPSKEALIALVAQSLRDDFLSQHQARPRDGQPPLALLRHELADFRETLFDRPEIFAVMTELSERARRDDKVAAIVRPMQGFWHRQVADILEAGRVDGSFRADLDAAAAATMILGSLVATTRLGADEGYFHRVADEIERAIVNPASPPRRNTRDDHAAT